jgi:His/Glu/Gln/Arg/opine family amino acid ABC transporter permease subunit
MNFNVDFFMEALWELREAIPLTLQLTIYAFVIGLIFALLLSIVRYKDIPVLRRIAQFYVSFIRGTPIMLQLYMVYYILPYALQVLLNGMGIPFAVNMLSTKALVVTALALNIAGFLAETIRGGLTALGRSEIEAAYSIGMKTGMVYRRIIIPQVAVLCIPNFSTNIIGILHASSLAYFVSLLELTGTARVLAHNNWNYFEAFAASGVIYWGLTVLIELGTVVLERIVEKHGYSLKT